MTNGARVGTVFGTDKMESDTVSYAQRKTSWSPARIRQELTRQRQRLTGRIESLDEEERQIADMAQRQAKRRPYAHKNNGKGRPRLRIKEFSKEKIRRRDLLRQEVVVLDELLPAAQDSAENFDMLLLGLLVAERSRVNLDRLRLKKIQQLCLQFWERPITHFPMPWDEAAVRAFFELWYSQVVLQFEAVGGKAVTKNDQVDAKWGKLFAQCELLGRLLTSDHLRSEASFASVLSSYLGDAPTQEILGSSQWKALWRETISYMVRRLAKAVAISSATQAKVSDRQPATESDDPLGAQAATDEIIPLDLDTVEEEPWTRRYRVFENAGEAERLERFYEAHLRLMNVIAFAANETRNPVLADPYVKAVIMQAETLTAAAKSLLGYRAGLFGRLEPAQRSAAQEAYQRSIHDVTVFGSAWLGELEVLAKDYSNAVEQNGGRRGNRDEAIWPALYAQLSARLLSTFIALNDEICGVSAV